MERVADDSVKSLGLKEYGETNARNNLQAANRGELYVKVGFI